MYYPNLRDEQLTDALAKWIRKAVEAHEELARLLTEMERRVDKRLEKALTEENEPYQTGQPDQAPPGESGPGREPPGRPGRPGPTRRARWKSRDV